MIICNHNNNNNNENIFNRNKLFLLDHKQPNDNLTIDLLTFFLLLFVVCINVISRCCFIEQIMQQESRTINQKLRSLGTNLSALKTCEFNVPKNYQLQLLFSRLKRPYAPTTAAAAAAGENNNSKSDWNSKPKPNKGYENIQRLSNHLHEAKTRLKDRWLRLDSTGSEAATHRKYSKNGSFIDTSNMSNRTKEDDLDDDLNEQIFKEIENLDDILNSQL